MEAEENFPHFCRSLSPWTAEIFLELQMGFDKSHINASVAMLFSPLLLMEFTTSTSKFSQYILHQEKIESKQQPLDSFVSLKVELIKSIWTFSMERTQKGVRGT